MSQIESPIYKDVLIEYISNLQAPRATIILSRILQKTVFTTNNTPQLDSNVFKIQKINMT